MEPAYLEIGPSNRVLVVPEHKNRTGQFLTTPKIQLLQLNQATDWLERAYRKRRANEIACWLCPYKSQKLANQ